MARSKEDEVAHTISTNLANIVHIPIWIWVLTWSLGVHVPSWWALVGLNTGVNVLYIALTVVFYALSRD